MIYYAMGAFAITLFNGILFIFTYRPRYLTPTTRAYFQWSFFVSAWSLGYGVTLGGFFDYQTTLVLNKFCQAMAALIGPFFFKLVSCLSDQYSKKQKIYSVYLCLGVIIASLLFFTDWFVSGLWAFHDFKYQPLGGPLYGLFVAFFLWCNLHGFLIALQQQGQSKGLKQKKNALFLIATGIGYGLSAELFLQGFKLPIDPHGVFFMFIYVVILGYAIFRYRFMDIEVIIKKTLVFAGLFGVMMTVVTIVTTVVQDFIGHYVKVTPAVVRSFSILSAIFLYEPTRKLLVALTDRFLFQRRFDYAKVLKDASREIALITSFNELTRKMLAVLSRKARTKSAAIYVRSAGQDQFELKGCYGYGRHQRPEMNLGADLAIITHLERHQSAFSRTSLEEALKKPQDETRKKELTQILQSMQALKAEVIVPSFLKTADHGEATSLRHSTLQNLLVLGGKKSDEDYYEQDLDMLATLAQEHAVTFEKIRLFDSVMSERESKLRAQSEAKLVSYAKTIGHEIKNALVGIEGPAIFLQRHQVVDLKQIFERFLKDQAPVAIQKKFLDVCGKIEKQAGDIFTRVQKIRVIASTAQGTLKSSEGEFEEIYFRILWEAAKEDVGRYDARFESDIPDNFVVYGNLVLLQRVLVNLLNNALEAMTLARQVDKKFTLKAYYEDREGVKGTCLECGDNGPGIPRAICDKIFEQGFSTKPKPKVTDINASGHGQGLYMCKEIIEVIHHGKLRVASEVGKGTTFTFWLPVQVEAKSEVVA